MDTITLKDCRFDCVIGVFPDERKRRQPIEIDIELSLDTRKAGKSDSVGDTVDYGAVHALMKDLVVASEYHLIEALAEDLAAATLKRFPVRSVTVSIRKPEPMRERQGAWAGVRITRSRR